MVRITVQQAVSPLFLETDRESYFCSRLLDDVDLLQANDALSHGIISVDDNL